MNLSVVIQGSISHRTKCVIQNWRRAVPECEIILSTWNHDITLAREVDLYVVSKDPGVFPVRYGSETLRNENTNRQIVSTRAGLDHATRKYCIKWRTDFDFNHNLMKVFLMRYFPLVENSNEKKIVVFGINTSNPYAGSKIVGQLSDWMYFGKRELLLNLISQSPIPINSKNTEIPKKILETKSFPIARFSAEQWMLREGLAAEYKISLNSFDDSTAKSPFLSVIGKNFLIVNPNIVGLRTEKYDYLVYFKIVYLRQYLGFRLATISQFESILLGNSILRFLGITSLIIKGLVFNCYKFLIDTCQKKNFLDKRKGK